MSWSSPNISFSKENTRSHAQEFGEKEKQILAALLHLGSSFAFCAHQANTAEVKAETSEWSHWKPVTATLYFGSSHRDRDIFDIPPDFSPFPPIFLFYFFTSSNQILTYFEERTQILIKFWNFFQAKNAPKFLIKFWKILASAKLRISAVTSTSRLPAPSRPSARNFPPSPLFFPAPCGPSTREFPPSPYFSLARCGPLARNFPPFPTFSRLLASLRPANSPRPPLFPGSLWAFSPRFPPLPLFPPAPCGPSARKFSPYPSFPRLPLGLQPAIFPTPPLPPLFSRLHDFHLVTWLGILSELISNRYFKTACWLQFKTQFRVLIESQRARACILRKLLEKYFSQRSFRCDFVSWLGILSELISNKYFKTACWLQFKTQFWLKANEQELASCASSWRNTFHNAAFVVTLFLDLASWASWSATASPNLERAFEKRVSHCSWFLLTSFLTLMSRTPWTLFITVFWTSLACSWH